MLIIKLEHVRRPAASRSGELDERRADHVQQHLRVLVELLVLAYERVVQGAGMAEPVNRLPVLVGVVALGALVDDELREFSERDV